jgi:hypothetical protein
MAPHITCGHAGIEELPRLPSFRRDMDATIPNFLQGSDRFSGAAAIDALDDTTMAEDVKSHSYRHADARTRTLELNFFAESSNIVEAAASLPVGQNRRRAPTIRVARCGERIRDRIALTG